MPSPGATTPVNGAELLSPVCGSMVQLIVGGGLAALGRLVGLPKTSTAMRPSAVH